MLSLRERQRRSACRRHGLSESASASARRHGRRRRTRVPAKRISELIRTAPGSSTTRRVSRLANLRAADHEAESPALRLTRYFANRGLGQPTAATGQLVLVVRSDSGWAIATLGPQHLRGQYAVAVLQQDGSILTDRDYHCLQFVHGRVAGVSAAAFRRSSRRVRSPPRSSRTRIELDAAAAHRTRRRADRRGASGSSTTRSAEPARHAAGTGRSTRRGR